jgi:HK97 gp10 family phage protein
MAKVEGLDRLLRQLRAIPAAVKTAAAAEVRAQADQLADSIRAAAPSGDGVLRASVRVTLAGDEAASTAGELKAQNGLKATVVAGDEEAFYVRWVEFGTAPHSTAPKADLSRGKRQAGPLHPGAKARPFFWPTVRARKRQFKSRMSRKLNAAVKQIAATSQPVSGQ